MIASNSRESGITEIGNIPWGTHISYFYYSIQDIIHPLVSYFRAGLKNNESCFLLTSNSDSKIELLNHLEKSIKNFPTHIKSKQFTILEYKNLFFQEIDKYNSKILEKWLDYYNNAKNEGYEGLRLSIDLKWLKKKTLKRYLDIEAQLSHFIKDYEIVFLCTYPINKFNKYEMLDIASSHQYVIFNKNGQFNVIENFERRLFEEEKKNLSLISRGVAHDFNKLLTIIKGYTELAKMESKKDSQIYKYLNEISQSILNSEKILEQLPRLSHYNINKRETLVINDLITTISHLFQHLITENIKIKLNLDKKLWKSNITLGKIEQVLINMITNARDALPNGGEISISTFNQKIRERDIEKIPNSKKGSFVCISVKDNGIGIKNEDLEKIFHPFFTTKETGRGTGLGLSICQIFIMEHKGWINVISEPNKGTEFRIYLPAEN